LTQRNIFILVRLSIFNRWLAN